MNWFDYFLIALFGANILATIGFIGHRREPITPLGAVGYTIFWGLIIAGILIF